MSKGRFFCGGSALAVTLALTIGASPSFAQDNVAPPGDDDNAATVDEVISTGTFIRGAAEDAAIPVEVIGRDELLQSGSPNIEELARSLSEVGNVQSQSARGTNSQGYGVSSINLRNLGSGRTLITMNGRRLADEPASNGGNVNATGGANQNINSIPMAALQQVEILKGGGGATYGSDAVAGVVNFITRKDLNGIEANASYKYIPDSRGDYDASVLWGRRSDFGNVLISAEYAHKSKIAAKDRDWAARPFDVSGFGGIGPVLANNLGSYQFLVSAPSGTLASSAQLITFGGTGLNQYRGATDPNNFPSIGQPVTGMAASLNSGLLRDDACLKIGGHRAWSTTPSPNCSSFVYEFENIKDDEERYVIFSDINFDVTDTLRYHSEANFSKTATTIIGASQGTASPCDPWPVNAPNATTTVAGSRQCNTVSVTTGVSGYSLPGYNPAVREYVMAYYNEPRNGSAPVRVLTDAQILDITGQAVTATTPLTVAGGGTVGQAYVPVGFGRMTLPTTTWLPFIAMRSPVFKNGIPTFKSENVSFRTTQELKGDLGEIWHNTIDFSAAATYSRNYTERDGRFIMPDRLQRAMNGFATNLDDLGPDGLGCTTAETSGTRVIAGTNVASVPYTVGGGGGSGDAPNGFNVGSAAGNRCFFFNPLSSAISNSRINGATPVASATDVGFLGGPAVGGTTGDYQGYVAGYGLANAPGIVRWLYANKTIRSETDTIQLTVQFNGVFNKWELPGGPIGWATGGEYRYLHRTAGANGLADDRVNACTFLSKSTQGLTDVDNIINATSTCATTTGPINDYPGSNGIQGVGFREEVKQALFAEFSLPVFDHIGADFQVRREEANVPFASGRVGATVMSGSVKYQVFPTFALRASLSESFDTPTIEATNTTTTTAQAAAAIFGAPTTNAQINTATLVVRKTNTALDPEEGLSYEVGAIFQTEDRRVQANIDYFHNVVNGRPTTITATTIGRALLGFRRVGQTLNTDDIIDCNSPTVKFLFQKGTQTALFGDEPIVQYIDANGNKDASGCKSGTTLAGFDVDGGTALVGNDLGLNITIPDRVNAANVKVAGIESNVSWRLPNTIYDGTVVVNGDITVNLLRKQDAVTLYGTIVTDPTDDTGTYNADFTGQVNIWRGSLSATYLRGKHNFTLRTSYIGGFADLATGSAAPTIPSSNVTNLNPPDPSLCGTTIANSVTLNAPVPFYSGNFPQLEPFLTGANGNFNQACNLNSNQGLHTRESVMLSATWRYEMPQRTTLSVSIDNILDTDPPYLALTYNYNPFGSIGSEGRTVKVAVSKKF